MEAWIHKLTVRQYMEVVSNPENFKNSAEDSLEYRILRQFRECTSSHRRREENRWQPHAWGAFAFVLVMFRYLNSDRQSFEEATNLRQLFALYEDDREVNPNKEIPPIYGTFSEMFLFPVVKYEENAFLDKWDAEAGEKENLDGILGAQLCKESTVDDVIQNLWANLTGDTKKADAFRKIAEVGFDTKCRDGAAVAPAAAGKLWKDCDRLYRAGARQIVFTGAPGTGKTYTAKKYAQSIVRAYAYANGRVSQDALKNQIATVQFHSSYDYSDFMEGLRPVQVTGTEGMTFVRLDGQFKAFCRKIVDAGEEDVPYFFIIDEINRADLSRVFGDLMFCLDESKRAARERVQTQYSNLRTYQIGEDDQAMPLAKDQDHYAAGFYIPKNLCILATMNDIDRSVESFDFALRRRFKWIAVDANEEMEAGLHGMLGGKVPGEQIRTLIQRAKNMNGCIAGGKDAAGEALRLTRDYHIGHAYFEKFTGDNWEEIWQTQIEQILREYCRGRSTAESTDAFVAACCKELLGQAEE